MRILVATTVALCVGYASLLEWGPKPREPQLQSQWQENQYLVEAYATLAQPPEAVVVGSSLARRLRFDPRCVYNLALAGDSALTGLGVVEKLASLPRVVFVETNFIGRDANPSLVAGASAWLPRLSPLFRVENMPVNLALAYLMKEPPVETVNEELARRVSLNQRPRYDNQLQPDALDKNLAEAKRLVEAIERRGTKVVLFEMPLHPDFESAPQMLQVRHAVHRVFQQTTFMSQQDLSHGQSMRTTDGLHLRMEEAAVVAVKLVGTLRDSCAPGK